MVEYPLATVYLPTLTPAQRASLVAAFYFHPQGKAEMEHFEGGFEKHGFMAIEEAINSKGVTEGNIVYLQLYFSRVLEKVLEGNPSPDFLYVLKGIHNFQF